MLSGLSSGRHWERYRLYFLRYEDIGLSIDVSRMNFPEDYISRMAARADHACQEMQKLEAGAIANPDEGRMVGHYWLRSPELAPSEEIRKGIAETREAVEDFAGRVHRGEILSGGGRKFSDVLVIGIGGSALGPQLVADSLGTVRDAMRMHFMDNTDPDGMSRVLDGIGHDLSDTMVLVISKSGGTKESRNGMLTVQAAFREAGLDFTKNFVAVTGVGSELDRVAEAEGWLRRFPMWDWVGGRTSVMSAVGLLPMALQGLDTGGFLAGARAMDDHTRTDDVRKNAAMLLALMWHYAGRGVGERDMVILPYKDRLVLLSRYLQQLVMESLGKELDLQGRVVHQGIAVYGNKGSTDQHAFVQQLRDGVNNFFVTFIEVRKSGDWQGPEVEPGVYSGDYLQGFLRGTRTALSEKGRESTTISIPRCDAFQLGGLIALFERAVGFYASLVNINAYHQPGVEAGKKAAARVLELQAAVLAYLSLERGVARKAAEIASAIGADCEETYHVAVHLAENRASVRMAAGRDPGEDKFMVL